MKLPFNVTFREAAAFFAKKVPLSRDEFNVLADDAKLRAFTVAGVTKASMIEDVRLAIQQAIADGLTLDDFVATLDDVLDTSGWNGFTPWRAETIFRTNVQSAYGSGRYEQQRRLRDEFPYLRYHAVHDGRTRPAHAALDGKVFAIGDARLRRIYPPWDYNCRCYMESLTAEEARAIGIEEAHTILPPSTDDFTSPGAGFEYVPDLSGFDAMIAADLEEALRTFNPRATRD